MKETIDLAPILRDAVATSYSDLVTRPTGVTVRHRIEAVIAAIYLDGALHHTESLEYFCFPNDTGPAPSGVCTQALFGAGTHTVEFRFQLQGTTTEIGAGTGAGAVIIGPGSGRKSGAATVFTATGGGSVSGAMES